MESCSAWNQPHCYGAAAQEHAGPTRPKQYRLADALPAVDGLRRSAADVPGGRKALNLNSNRACRLRHEERRRDTNPSAHLQIRQSDLSRRRYSIVFCRTEFRQGLPLGGAHCKMGVCGSTMGSSRSPPIILVFERLRLEGETQADLQCHGRSPAVRLKSGIDRRDCRAAVAKIRVVDGKACVHGARDLAVN